MDRRAFLQAIPVAPAAVVAALAIPSRQAVGMDGAGADDAFTFAFRTGQSVAIMTDLGRSGTIMRRRVGYLMNEQPDYLVRRSFNGEPEWYPEFVLKA